MGYRNQGTRVNFAMKEKIVVVLKTTTLSMRDIANRFHVSPSVVTTINREFRCRPRGFIPERLQ